MSRLFTLISCLMLTTISCGGEDEPEDDPACVAAVEKLEDCGVSEEDVVYACPKEGEATDDDECFYSCVEVLSCAGLMSQTFFDCVGSCNPDE